MMKASPPSSEELEALLKLLDDETPEVRTRVAERFATSSGDLSEWLASHSRVLSERERKLLAKMLRPPRCENLMREWIAPTGGAAALQEDWETFEALLEALSDFLHDGVSLRQSLPDALDLLAEEASDHDVSSSDELRKFLFTAKRLVGNVQNYYDPRNSDLAWCLAENRSNPLGLCLIFMLVGRRLDLEIEGVNFPGHFMCRIFEDGLPWIVDCFDQGRVHAQAKVLESPELTRPEKNILRQPIDLGSILRRLLNNLQESFRREQRDEDVELVNRLLMTL